MKKTLFVAAAVATASLSFAQNAPFEPPANSGVRIGYVLPIDSRLRDASSSYFGLGLDLPVSFSLARDAEGYLSFDWVGRTGSGAKGNFFPILFQQRFYAKTAPGMPRSYFALGAGVTFIDVASSGTALSARLAYGQEFGQNLYGEAALLYSDSVSGVHATSAGFYLGYRF